MNLNPQIHTFKIQPGQPSRVYFDSSKPINAGANGINGFIIQGRTITSVTTVPGLTTGHYFTLSAALTYWDGILIRYEGSLDSDFNVVNNQSTIVDDLGNPLFDFRLMRIVNNLPEPDTTIERFVTLTGNNGSDGKTESTAWRTVEYGVGQINQGTTLWVKAGNYGNESFVMPGGTASAPIKIIGYKNIPGDAVNLARTRGMVLKNTADEMPYFENGSSSNWVSSGGNDYVIMQNIQTSNQADVCYNFVNSSYIILRNCYMDESSHGVYGNLSDGSKGWRVIDSYIANMNSTGVRIWGQGGLVDNTWSVTSRASSHDYYLCIRGSDIVGHGHSNLIVNSKIHRFEDDVHTGHGLSVAAPLGSSQRYTKFNLLQSCEVINCTNSGIEFRYSGSSHNVARDILMRGEDHLSNLSYGFKGYTLNEDTHHNVIEQCTVYHSNEGLRFVDTTSDLGNDQAGGFDNRFIGCVWDDVRTAIGTTASVVNLRNSFIGCTFRNINRMFVRSQSYLPEIDYPPANWLDDTNEFLNCILDKVVNGDYNGAVEVKFNYTNFYSSNGGDWSGSAKAGTNNLNVDPQYSEFPTVTNPALNVGLSDLLSKYDYFGNQVVAPTIGAVEIVTETPPSDINVDLMWVISNSYKVTHTIIKRDDIELIRVPVTEPSVYKDNNVTSGTTYKYEIQDINTLLVESDQTDETPGGNVVYITTD